MGGSLQGGQQVLASFHGKLKFNLKVGAEELETLKELVKERSDFKHQNLCSVQRLYNLQEPSSNIFCQNFSEVVIEYEAYDCLLSDLKQAYPLAQMEIERLIYCVCLALKFLESRRSRHGDINPRLICRSKGQWRLVDNYFIRGGITAYEKVLEGQQGFISPAQMQKIRHGFIRQSPPIEESDDVFALGMTCLEIATARPSSCCYKESYIRFNDKNLTDSKAALIRNYPPQSGLAQLILGMIQPNQERRLSLNHILVQPIIGRHSRKYSLRSPPLR